MKGGPDETSRSHLGGQFDSGPLATACCRAIGQGTPAKYIAAANIAGHDERVRSPSLSLLLCCRECHRRDRAVVPFKLPRIAALFREVSELSILIDRRAGDDACTGSVIARKHKSREFVCARVQRVKYGKWKNDVGGMPAFSSRLASRYRTASRRPVNSRRGKCVEIGQWRRPEQRRSRLPRLPRLPAMRDAVREIALNRRSCDAFPRRNIRGLSSSSGRRPSLNALCETLPLRRAAPGKQQVHAVCTYAYEVPARARMLSIGDISDRGDGTPRGRSGLLQTTAFSPSLSFSRFCESLCWENARVIVCRLLLNVADTAESCDPTVRYGDFNGSLTRNSASYVSIVWNLRFLLCFTRANPSFDSIICEFTHFLRLPGGRTLLRNENNRVKSSCLRCNYFHLHPAVGKIDSCTMR